MKSEMKNKELCSGCSAKCCKYVAIEIDCPEELEDFEDIKWYVAHENINVYVDEDDEWHVEFITRCKYLDEDNLCKIYSKRPSICKQYCQDECPHHNEYSEKFVFTDIEDVENYIKNIFEKGKHVVVEEDD